MVLGALFGLLDKLRLDVGGESVAGLAGETVEPVGGDEELRLGVDTLLGAPKVSGLVVAEVSAETTHLTLLGVGSLNFDLLAIKDKGEVRALQDNGSIPLSPVLGNLRTTAGADGDILASALGASGAILDLNADLGTKPGAARLGPEGDGGADTAEENLDLLGDMVNSDVTGEDAEALGLAAVLGEDVVALVHLNLGGPVLESLEETSLELAGGVDITTNNRLNESLIDGLATNLRDHVDHGVGHADVLKLNILRGPVDGHVEGLNSRVEVEPDGGGARGARPGSRSLNLVDVGPEVSLGHLNNIVVGPEDVLGTVPVLSVEGDLVEGSSLLADLVGDLGELG